MNAIPSYLLWIDTVGEEPGEWRFVLQRTSEEGEPLEVELDITDVEPDVRGERLELLSVVRGLEALDQASRVAVVTSSRYVRIGMERHLPQWRAKGWMWESFGRLETVKHADLWRRLDQASRIHEIRCVTPASIGQVAQTDRVEEGGMLEGGADNASQRQSAPEKESALHTGEAAPAARATQHRLDAGHGPMPRRHTTVLRNAKSKLWGLVQNLVRG